MQRFDTKPADVSCAVNDHAPRGRRVGTERSFAQPAHAVSHPGRMMGSGAKVASHQLPATVAFAPSATGHAVFGEPRKTSWISCLWLR